jgi:hypothetical protein
MSSAAELIQTVKANGGQIRVENGWLVVAPEDAAAPLIEELRQHKAEIISLLESASIPPHDPAEWREPFVRWLDSACVLSPRCFGGVAALHDAFCDWESGRGGVPCVLYVFEQMLNELGLLIGEVAGWVFVSGLILREDFEAVLLSSPRELPSSATGNNFPSS